MRNKPVLQKRQPGAGSEPTHTAQSPSARPAPTFPTPGRSSGTTALTPPAAHHPIPLPQIQNLDSKAIQRHKPKKTSITLTVIDEALGMGDVRGQRSKDGGEDELVLLDLLPLIGDR